MFRRLQIWITVNLATKTMFPYMLSNCEFNQDRLILGSYLSVAVVADFRLSAELASLRDSLYLIHKMGTHFTFFIVGTFVVH